MADQRNQVHPDGHDKPITPQYDIRSDMVRRGPQPIDRDPPSGPAIERRRRPDFDY